MKEYPVKLEQPYSIPGDYPQDHDLEFRSRAKLADPISIHDYPHSIPEVKTAQAKESHIINRDTAAVPSSPTPPHTPVRVKTPAPVNDDRASHGLSMSHYGLRPRKVTKHEVKRTTQPPSFVTGYQKTRVSRDATSTASPEAFGLPHTRSTLDAISPPAGSPHRSSRSAKLSNTPIDTMLRTDTSSKPIIPHKASEYPNHAEKRRPSGYKIRRADVLRFIRVSALYTSPLPICPITDQCHLGSRGTIRGGRYRP